MTDDLFDLEKHAVPDIPTTTVPPRRIVKRREQFVQVPLVAADTLGKACRDKSWALYLHLLHETWKAKAWGKPVKVANGFLTMLGIDRFAKWRALGKLERLGLIEVERRDSKSPLVKIL
jgi:hypothetical protein